MSGNAIATDHPGLGAAIDLFDATLIRSRGLSNGPSFSMGMRLPVIRTLTIIICFCLVPQAKPHYLAAQVILPVSGRVVDGVTGMPIQGISLTLQISTYEGLSVHTEVKNTATSNLSGRFSLAGASHPGTSPLDQIRSYWLTVNEVLEATGQEENSAETQTLYNPMSNRRGWEVGDKRYFPLTVSFRPEGCDRVWAAACMYIASRTDIVIPLIPVLDDVYGCNAIGDSSLKEKCRQLNTYRGAFLHVDSYEKVKKGKELCNEVDGGTISKACLWQLELYVANPAYERPIKPQANEPIPDGMFPESLAGLHVTKNKHCGPRLEFSGRVMCTAGYGTETEQLVAVLIEEWPDSEQSTVPPPWDPSYRDHEHATVTEEQRPHGKVLRYHGPQCNSFFWYSGDRHIEVLSCYPVPQLEQFVSYYLSKFPSNFR